MTCVYQGFACSISLTSYNSSTETMTTKLEPRSEPEPEGEPDTHLSGSFIYDHAALLWVSVAVSVILLLVSTTGNILVFIVVGRRKKIGVFRHLKYAIRSLAITDVLLGLVGMPLIIAYSYLG